MRYLLAILAILAMLWFPGCTPQAIGPNYLMDPNQPINITINVKVDVQPGAVVVPVTIDPNISFTMPVNFAPNITIEGHLLKGQEPNQ